MKKDRRLTEAEDTHEGKVLTAEKGEWRNISEYHDDSLVSK